MKNYFIFIFLLLAFNVNAQEYRWTGNSNNNDFFDELNWVEFISNNIPAENSINPGQPIGFSLYLTCEIIADGVSAQFLGASEQTQLLGSNFVNQLDVSGLTTFRNDVFVDNATLDVTGLTTTDNLFAGIATILLLDVEQIEADNMNTGVGTVGNLVVSGSADFEGDVVVAQHLF